MKIVFWSWRLDNKECLWYKIWRSQLKKNESRRSWKGKMCKHALYFWLCHQIKMHANCNSQSGSWFWGGCNVWLQVCLKCAPDAERPSGSCFWIPAQLPTGSSGSSLPHLFGRVHTTKACVLELYYHRVVGLCFVSVDGTHPAVVVTDTKLQFDVFLWSQHRETAALVLEASKPPH